MARHRLYRDDTLVYDYTDPIAGETCEQFVTRMYAQYAKVNAPADDPGGHAYWVGRCNGSIPPQLTHEQIDAEFQKVYPPAVPPPSGDAINLTDGVMKPYLFAEGQPKDFFFDVRDPGGTIELKMVPVAGTAGGTVHYSINGGAEVTMTPSGSDWHAELINGWVAKGRHTVRIRMTGILGEGRYGVQAQGWLGS